MPARSPGHRRRPVFPIALLFVLVLVADARAGIVRVPEDQPDLRAAVAAAASRDTVLLAPGSYTGGAYISGKALTIGSRYLVTGDTALVAQTILHGVVTGLCNGAPGCQGTSVLEFGAGASGSAVVGLTLSNGENGVSSVATVDVLHCRVIANGDGVDYSIGGGGTLGGNLFSANTDDGIDLNGHMTLTIVDNDIRNNGDDGIEYRLYTWAGATQQVSITGNRISGNHEDGVELIDYVGNGNYSIRIEHNLFQSNYDATGSSTAIGFTPGGETVEMLVGAPSTRRTYILNNTFIGEKNGVVGGANVIALNNIFSNVPGIALKRVNGASIAAYNLFWTCGTNYSESTVDAPHVVLANPLLFPNGRLGDASPAINAGTAFYQWNGETVLNLPAASYQESAPDLGAFESVPNTAPVVNAGADRTVTLSADVEDAGTPGAPRFRADAPLAATVSDDGQPYPPAPSILWTLVSGPGPVLFQNPMAVDARATFSVPGSYVLQLTVFDGKLGGSDQVEVTVLPPVNQTPQVDAGRHQTVVLPARARLQGMVLDDGLPSPPAAVTVAWSTFSGPGAVGIQNGATLTPQATFTVPGSYLLQMTAGDGELSVSDTVGVTVLPVPNAPPSVSAGPDVTVMFPSDAVLDGTVSDDGLPSPPAAVTTTWTLVNGPGAVTFANAAAVDTRAGFGAPGTYLLRLSASDGALAASDLVQVTVLPPPPPFETRIAAATDDAEERTSSHVDLNDLRLDMVGGAGNAAVGLRFTGVAVPPGATIIAAWVQFTTGATAADTTSLTIEAQASDNPLTFGSTRNGITLRPRTVAHAAWSPAPWTAVGEAAAAQRTSDLKAPIQEIVNRPGWASGNAVALILTGPGRRYASSYDQGPAVAPLLHVEYGGLPVSAATRAPAPGAALPAARVSAATAADGATAHGAGLALGPIRPQPARGPFTVAFTLPDDRPATLELHDVAGRLVASRAVGALGAGEHAVSFDERLSAGIYLVKLDQGGRTVVRKAIMVR